MAEKYKYQLSVIIVNYNVEFFLDQCISSVKKASKNLRTEIIVVDNNSVDDSLEMVKSKYPECQLITNKDNLGFSKANNQAIEASSGEFVVLLNPDTVVAEDTFEKVLEFIEKHPDCGGLGVRMIDGKGTFLPESKRGLPTPKVAFYKIFGLAALFPRSKRFGQYHLGHLSEFENHEIDVLSGAFMLMRKQALDKVGLLDESFFMYGEDIDLSYRITQGGYKNYYCSDTTIIHYKGESTKKSSVNYVMVFYNAMIIFASKHFSGKQARLFSSLINVAIYLRAALAISVRFIKALILPLIDFIYIVGGLFLLTNYWKMSHIEFPHQLIKYSIPIYTAVWLGTTLFNGGYDYPIRFYKFLKGVFWGTVFILVGYAILPKDMQFSRLFIFVGAAWIISYYLISRVLLHVFIGKKYNLKKYNNSHFGVVGSDKEFERVKALIEQTNSHVSEIIHIQSELNKGDLTTIDEIVFCAKDLSHKSIIEAMSNLNDPKLDFKIAPPEVNYMIGSNSIDTAGDLYILNLNNLISKENKRKKRLFDLSFSMLLLLISPVHILWIKNKTNYLQKVSKVFLGKLTFVGFSEQDIQRDVRLPKIKEGLLSPSDGIEGVNEIIRGKLNLLYSRDYSMRKDFAILVRAWNKIDQ